MSISLTAQIMKNHDRVSNKRETELGLGFTSCNNMVDRLDQPKKEGKEEANGTDQEKTIKT